MVAQVDYLEIISNENTRFFIIISNDDNNYKQLKIPECNKNNKNKVIRIKN